MPSLAAMEFGSGDDGDFQDFGPEDFSPLGGNLDYLRPGLCSRVALGVVLVLIFEKVLELLIGFDIEDPVAMDDLAMFGNLDHLSFSVVVVGFGFSMLSIDRGWRFVNLFVQIFFFLVSTV